MLLSLEPLIYDKNSRNNVFLFINISIESVVARPSNGYYYMLLASRHSHRNFIRDEVCLPAKLK